MIRLEHVNLVVRDIDATLTFLQTAFPGWRVRGRGESEWYGRKRNWLHVGTDDYYITLNDGAEGENRDLRGHTPGLSHIGFCVDDMEGVSRRLQAAGYAIATLGPEHPHRRTIYFHDPEGFEFEFIEYLSERAKDRNMYGGETAPMRRLASA